MYKHTLFIILFTHSLFSWSQVDKPDYIEGYACSGGFSSNKNGDTLGWYWVQYIGVNKINKHVHDYKIYYSDSSSEMNQFVTFDSLDVNPANKKYQFLNLSYTLPTIVVDGDSTEVIGAYSPSYYECYFNNFNNTSHKVLVIESSGGADYPCVLKYDKKGNEISVLLRCDKGNTLIKFIAPIKVGNSSKEIIAIDFRNNKILLENHDEWIKLESVVLK